MLFPGSRSHGRKHNARETARRSVRPCLEQLERREMLAASFTSLNPPASGTEGLVINGPVASFRDSDPNVNNYSAVVTWGDGQSDSLSGATGGIVKNADGTFSVVAAHTFIEATSLGKGIFQVQGNGIFQVQVTDGSAATTSTSALVRVTDAPLTITAFNPQMGGTEGVMYSGTVATFTDTNPNPDIKDFFAAISWGDDSSLFLLGANGGIVPNADGSFSVVASHAYVADGRNGSAGNGVFLVEIGDSATFTITSATVQITDAPLTITSVQVPPNATEGQTISGTVATFTDANPNPNISDFSAQVSWGDGSADTLNAANGGIVQNPDGSFSVVASHTYEVQPGAFGYYQGVFQVQINDIGGAFVTTSARANVADAPLTFTSLNAPASASPGVTIGGTFATFTDANPNPNLRNLGATIFWGDGSADSLDVSNGGIVANAGGSFSLVSSHTYGRLEEDLFQVQLFDLSGAFTATSAAFQATGSVAFTTVNPPPSGLAEGQAFSGTVATFVDSNPNAPVTEFSATISWGDPGASGGQIVQNADGSFSVLGSHTFEDFLPAGSGYDDKGILSVDVYDSHDQSHTATSATLQVIDAPLAITTSNPPTSATEGMTQYSGTVATFSDANPNSDINDFSSIVLWGDGSGSNLTAANGGIVPNPDGSFSIVASHAYAQAPPPGLQSLFQVQVFDIAGAFAATSATVDIADAAVTITSFTPPAELTEGQPFSGTVATFTDADPHPDINNFSAAILWGDGSRSDLTAASGGIVPNADGSFSIVASHTSQEIHGITIFQVRILDPDGAIAVTSATVQWIDAPLSITSISPPTGLIGGQTFSGTVATFTDANSNPLIGNFYAVVVWGDGSADILSPATGGIVQNADGSFSVVGTHQYSQSLTDAAFVVQISDTGGSVTATLATINPSSLGIQSLQPPAATEGQSFSGAVAVFSDPGATAGSLSATIAWGDGATDTLTSANGGIVDNGDGTFSVVGAHAYAEEGKNLLFSVQVADAGGASASTAATIKVNDADLTLQTLTAPTGITEGGSTGSLVLATFSDANSNPDINDFTATVSWGDGASDTLTAANGGIVNNGGGAFAILGGHLYAEEGNNLPIAVQVADTGGASAATVATIDVADAPVRLQTLTPLTNVPEGVSTGSLTLATFSDANPKPDINDYTATVTWGDGATDTLTAAGGGIMDNGDGTFSVVGAHAYAEEGKNLLFSVQVADAGGASDSAAITVTVGDAALTIQALTPPAATEGVNTGSVGLATFTDANSNPDILDYTATVTWGDGSFDTLTAANGGIVDNGNGTFSVLGSHLYAEEVSNLPFSLQVVDAGGASAATAGTVSVADAPLTFTTVTPPATTEGVSSGSFALATFRDANGNPDINEYTAIVTWGDSTSDTLTAANGGIVSNGGSFAVLDSHTYNEEGGYTFTVLVSDVGGSNAFSRLAVGVADAPLTMTKFAPPQNAVAGQSTGLLTVATFSDANSSPDITDYTATVSWGDGSTDTLTSANGGIKASGGAFAVVDAHTYSKPYSGITFAVRIVDHGGAATSSSATINVSGAKSGLVITQFTPPSPAEGQLASATLAVFTDTNVGVDPAHLTATETFGDGTSAVATLKNGGIVKNADGSYSVLLRHTYREESAGLMLKVSITDGKATAATSAVLRVADAPLSVHTLTPPAPVVGRQLTSTLLTFTDGNGRPDVRDFTAMVSWGDGSTSTLTSANGGIRGVTTFSVLGTHTYAQVGNYTLSIQVLDVGGSSTSTAAIAHVNPRGHAPVPGHTVTGGQDDGMHQVAPPRQALSGGDDSGPALPLLTFALWTDLGSQLGWAGAGNNLPVAASAPLWDGQGLSPSEVASSFLLQNEISLGLNQEWMTRRRTNGMPDMAAGQD
jgi:hypothetical protein